MNRWTMMNVNFFRTVSKNINRWFDLIDETQLYIVANSDLTMDYPKPLFPNVISVEELSAEDAKPLSEGKYIKGTPLCSMIWKCQMIQIGSRQPLLDEKEASTELTYD